MNAPACKKVSLYGPIVKTDGIKKRKRRRFYRGVILGKGETCSVFNQIKPLPFINGRGCCFQGDYNVCFMLQNHAPCVVLPACFRRGLSGVKVRVMRLFCRYMKAVSRGER